MQNVQLEHANVTVTDPLKTSAWLTEVFGWEIRWQGASKDNGFTVHIGNDSSYLALYAPEGSVMDGGTSYSQRGGLNHLAVVVEDLDEIETKVRAAGFTPHNHGDYEPGRRFYFEDADGIEFEVVHYEDAA